MWRSLLLVLALGACLGPVPGAQRMPSDITGLSGVTSDTVRVSTHAHHVILARVMQVQHRDRRVFAILLGRSFDGVHPGLRIASVWHAGDRMPYRAARRGTPFCQGQDCLARTIGTVFLTEAGFGRSAETGMTLRLLGPDGAVDVAIPARLFAQARAIAAAQQVD